jgi:hypothetical protein
MSHGEYPSRCVRRILQRIFKLLRTAYSDKGDRIHYNINGEMDWIFEPALMWMNIPEEIRNRLIMIKFKMELKWEYVGNQ